MRLWKMKIQNLVSESVKVQQMYQNIKSRLWLINIIFKKIIMIATVFLTNS